MTVRWLPTKELRDLRQTAEHQRRIDAATIIDGLLRHWSLRAGLDRESAIDYGALEGQSRMSSRREPIGVLTTGDPVRPGSARGEDDPERPPSHGRQ
jgi:hypothetical protein